MNKELIEILIALRSQALEGNICKLITNGMFQQYRKNCFNVTRCGNCLGHFSKQSTPLYINQIIIATSSQLTK